MSTVSKTSSHVEFMLLQTAWHVAAIHTITADVATITAGPTHAVMLAATSDKLARRHYSQSMGPKKKVDLERLAAALGDFPFAYLITVDDDYRAHTVTVEPVLRDGILDVGLIGGRTTKNLANRNDATLLWPPYEAGGYSLIVDGRAAVTDADNDTVHLEIKPTKALLHRNADSPTAAKGCLHDCVVFSET